MSDSGFYTLYCSLILQLFITNTSLEGARFPLLSAHDADVGGNSLKSYKLSPNEHFSLDVQSGGESAVSAELVLQKPLDREKQSVIQLLLTAVDGGKPPRSGTLQIVVNVLDNNDNSPVFSKSLYKVSVLENVPRGSRIIQLNATDLDQGLNGEILYSFSTHGDKNIFNIFEINSTTGEIIVKDYIDYEETSAFEIRVQAQDRGLSPMISHCKVLVEVLDANDNAPEILVTSLSSTVKEDSNNGTAVALITVSDKDSGKNSIVKCLILGKIPFKLSSSYRNYYSLVVDGQLDRERISQYNVTIIATDEGTPPLSSTSVITVHVSDVNDNAPRFPDSDLSIFVRENSPVGALVQTVTALDEDANENAQVTYSLLELNTLESFTINQETGEISVKGNLDYEENAAFEIRVQAKDKGQSPRSTHCKVLIEIIDMNDNAPEISVTSLTSTVREDATIGTAVALITVLDVDGGKNGAVNCKISESPFKLQSSYKNYYSLLVNGPLDRESTSHYNVTITATDEGTPPLSSTSVFTIQVSDVNDNAPSFPHPQISMYLQENSPVGTLIQTVSAVDADAKENAQIMYSLLDNKSKGVVSTMLNINSVTGEIYSTQPLNYEEVKILQFRVQATDSGVPPLSSNMTVNVFILDENDNSPGILPPYSDQAGYFVAKIRAVDADSGYNALLSYHIAEPKGSTLFKIATSTGEIRTKRRLNDKDLKTHPLVILISDNGDPSLSATVSIDILVVENNREIPPKFKQPRVKQHFSILNLYLLIGIVSVSLIFFLSLTSLIAIKCHKTQCKIVTGKYFSILIF
uniref:Protocadherin 2 alpha a 3 n=1 Tax=Scleropages formosus TaxID=113540 RepID=A0A8C9W0Y7_SCLFO